MNFTQIQSAVLKVARPYRFTSTEVQTGINETMLEIAASVELPDLLSNDDVTTTSNAYVAMPSTFHRKLLFAYSAAQEIQVPKNFEQYNMFLGEYPGLDTVGAVAATCVRGANLYYQGIPATADTLTLHFYRKPVDMSATTDEPDGLPEHLHRRLLVSLTVLNLLDTIPEDSTKLLVDIKKHQKNVAMGYSQLVDFAGPPENRAYEIQDENPYV